MGNIIQFPANKNKSVPIINIEPARVIYINPSDATDTDKTDAVALVRGLVVAYDISPCDVYPWLTFGLWDS